MRWSLDPWSTTKFHSLPTLFVIKRGLLQHRFLKANCCRSCILDRILAHFETTSLRPEDEGIPPPAPGRQTIGDHNMISGSQLLVSRSSVLNICRLAWNPELAVLALTQLYLYQASNQKVAGVTIRSQNDSHVPMPPIDDRMFNHFGTSKFSYGFKLNIGIASFALSTKKRIMKTAEKEKIVASASPWNQKKKTKV